jgi:hypothetical protein
MRGAIAALVLTALVAPGTAVAQSDTASVTSAGPQRVAVTVYRNPWRQRDAAIDLDYLQGFALITETRTVRLPKGPAVLRFEGVAEGIVPVSAIVDGLPGGTIEKNRDARLLSPAALIDGTLGRSVTLTRTDRATGRRRSEAATIVAGPANGVVLKTAAGIETLRCSGLPEGLTFGGIPRGLSAKPVLSVVTDTPSARTVTVILSYLASGFDWSSSYIATLTPGGRTLDLFAWATLANGNPETFVDADVKVVAGRLNRQDSGWWRQRAAALELRCYPLGTTTSDLKLEEPEESQDIIVTGARMMMAVPPPPPPAAPVAMAPPPPPENLGDLKLYRVPRAVTVAPRAQKQVALLTASGVPFERRYRRRVGAGEVLEAAPTGVVLVVRNRAEARLGMPLPSGTTALYAPARGTRLLLGTGALRDRAIGETLRIAAGESAQVLVEQRRNTPQEAVLKVSNANPLAVTVELPIGAAGQKIEADEGEVVEVDGIRTWQVTVPAHGTASVTYRF